MAANKYAYERYAQGLLDFRPSRAFEARAEMLTLTENDYTRGVRAENLSDFDLIAFVHTVERWAEAGYNLHQTALELGMSYETLARRRAEAKRRGLVPADR